ncbi:unnamed protein product [Schistosoma margrebowiei]|uniref:Uncharacterized protein n=1 Tax=Schistosoma margrebowiei TaxID=48269 RepID=A0A3P7XMN0_9TREM|nr:unnamed protein product [Schistosoma margrebowiei]
MWDDHDYKVVKTTSHICVITCFPTSCVCVVNNYWAVPRTSSIISIIMTPLVSFTQSTGVKLVLIAVRF